MLYFQLKREIQRAFDFIVFKTIRDGWLFFDALKVFKTATTFQTLYIENTDVLRLDTTIPTRQAVGTNTKRRERADLVAITKAEVGDMAAEVIEAMKEIKLTDAIMKGLEVDMKTGSGMMKIIKIKSLFGLENQPGHMIGQALTEVVVNSIV
ncbi:hypothetical protein ACSS6W_005351 [Trichoderma asperelloides]